MGMADPSRPTFVCLGAYDNKLKATGKQTVSGSSTDGQLYPTGSCLS